METLTFPRFLGWVWGLRRVVIGVGLGVLFGAVMLAAYHHHGGAAPPVAQIEPPYRVHRSARVVYAPQSAPAYAPAASPDKSADALNAAALRGYVSPPVVVPPVPVPAYAYQVGTMQPQNFYVVRSQPAMPMMWMARGGFGHFGHGGRR